MAGTTRAVFLSYRREETRHIAGRLADRLTERLGSTQVFMDVDTVEPGADFAVAIAREVALCHVLIALIGPTWSTIVDRRGRRRLEDPDDFVVLEIRAALERGIHVIPVLIDGAAMPDRDDLPEGLRGLARRNAARLDHETFLSDVTVLLNAVDRILATLPQKATEPTVSTAADRAITHNKEHPEQTSRASKPGVLLAGQKDVASAQHPPLPVPVLIPSWPLPWLRLRPRLLLIAVIVITVIVAGSIALLTTNDSPPRVTATIPTGDAPSCVAISPDGRHAYITNYNADSVSVIDTGSNTVTATIPTGDAPFGVAISPDGRHAHITNYNASSVSVIDTGSNTVTATIPTGNYPVDVAISPDGRHAYITNREANSVSVIDTNGNTVTATIPTGNYPAGVAISPDGRHAYITNRDADSVSVIDTSSNTVTATIPTGDYPVDVAISPDGRHAYITNRDADSVSVIDTGTR